MLLHTEWYKSIIIINILIPVEYFHVSCISKPLLIQTSGGIVATNLGELSHSSSAALITRWNFLPWTVHSQRSQHKLLLSLFNDCRERKKSLSENQLLYPFGNAIPCSLPPYFNSMSDIMQYTQLNWCAASQCSNAQHWQSWICGWSHHQQICCSTDSLGEL